MCVYYVYVYGHIHILYTRICMYILICLWSDNSLCTAIRFSLRAGYEMGNSAGVRGSHCTDHCDCPQAGRKNFS